MLFTSTQYFQPISPSLQYSEFYTITIAIYSQPCGLSFVSPHPLHPSIDGFTFDTTYGQQSLGGFTRKLFARRTPTYTMSKTAPEVGDTAGRVLRTMAQTEQHNDGDLVLASDVRWRLGMSHELLNYHLNRLAKKGLIETVGTIDVGHHKDAHAYQLTVDGQRVAADVDARQAVADEMDALREQVARNEDMIDSLWTRIAELEERVD